MKKQYLLGTLAFACMVALSAPSHAQSTSNGTGTSNVNAQQSTAANSTNAGVTALVNQYGADNIHSNVSSQVPLSVVGYGSFSQNGCVSSVGLGATTKIFSFVYNAPTPELNCQHAVRSDEFGREAQLAKSQDKPIQAETMRALSVWQACTSDDETIAACIRMGSIAYVDPEHPDIHQTKPVAHFDETAGTRVITSSTAQVIPGAVARESQQLADNQATQGPSTLNTTNVSTQRWYQNAQHN